MPFRPRYRNGCYRCEAKRRFLAVFLLANLMSLITPIATPFGGLSICTGQDSAIQMEDVTLESGIEFVHTHGGGGMGYIVEGMATGLATFDYDQDGFVDVYLLNGAPLQGTSPPADGVRPTNRLYRNNGDWTFTDVTQEAGVGDDGYGLGVAAGDYDGDGHVDLYVNNFGANRLYRNNGDKTFTDVTEIAGVGNGEQVGAGVGFLDIDDDGDLDLYVANYVNFTYENHVPIIIDGKRFQAGPQYYKPVPDTLFRNNGDGTFTDISQESRITAVAGPGMGLVCCDLDLDGDQDIYVCNDGQPNYFFQNDGSGKFDEVGLLFGAACDFSGKANSSMGVDCGDFDQDGLPDLIVTNYQAEMPVLYRNLGQGLFEDATSRARIPQTLFPHVNWGTAFVDFDNDGDRDIFIACGHFDRIEDIDDRTAQKVQNYLLLNEGGRFVDVSASAGPGMQVVETSRGVAFEDFDNDGLVDCLVVNSNARPTLLRNTSKTKAKWLQLELRQRGLNPAGVGAIVTLQADQAVGRAKSQMQMVMRGRGYQSDFGHRLHFGLGQSERAEVRVRWPDGVEESFELTAGDFHKLERSVYP